MQVGLTQHETMITWIGKHDEVTDQGKKYQVPLMIRHVITKGDQVPVRSIQFCRRFVLYISYPEIPELSGSHFMQAYFPLSQPFFMILDHGFVITAVHAVFFIKSLFKFFSGYH